MEILESSKKQLSNISTFSQEFERSKTFMGLFGGNDITLQKKKPVSGVSNFPTAVRIQILRYNPLLITVFIGNTTPPRRHRQRSSMARPPTPKPPATALFLPCEASRYRQDGGGPVGQGPVRPRGRRPKAKPGRGQSPHSPGEQVS